MSFRNFIILDSVAELLQTKVPHSPQMMADLQSVAAALLDTVNDKNVALAHQRKTNRCARQQPNTRQKHPQMMMYGL